jgi:hypothetical protein
MHRFIAFYPTVQSGRRIQFHSTVHKYGCIFLFSFQYNSAELIDWEREKLQFLFSLKITEIELVVSNLLAEIPGVARDSRSTSFLGN